MRDWLSRLLAHPWIDRSIAVVACAPFVYRIAFDLLRYRLSIERAVALVQLVVLTATMFVRRAPVRVTTNPWFWLLTLVATYWGYLPIAFAWGHPLLPPAVTDALCLASLAVILYGRLSVGRNIGLVTAQRQLVSGGAYRFVRHPIYAGLVLFSLAVVLRHYTLASALVSAAASACLMVKGVVEERFLREDPAYAEYMRTVRWRWFPGIA